MDVTVRINEYSKKGLLAYASVKFDDAFRLDNIRLMMAQEGGVKIVLPEYVKDGVAHEIFHPVNSDAREKFDIALLTAYSNLLTQQESETTFKNYSNKDFAVSAVKSTMYEKNNIVGLANVYFAGDYVLDGVRICEGQRGTFLNMPQAKHIVKENGRTVYNMDGTPKVTYSDIFYPLTTDAYGHMYSEVMQNYNLQVMMYENAVSVVIEDTGKTVKLPNFILPDITTEDLIASNIGNGVNFDNEKGMFSMSQQQYRAVKSTILNENYSFIAQEKAKALEAEKAAKKRSTRQKVADNKQKTAQKNKRIDKTINKTKEKSQDIEGR